MPPSDEQAHRIRERRKQLVQLVLAGVDWATIADRLNYASPGAACTDYRRAKQASQVELNRSVEEARWMEVDRIDRLQAAVWPKALKGDTRAADTCHRLIMSRCDLLGLKAPTQIQLSARLDLESAVVAEAVIAALDALGLEPSQRVVAFNAAQSRLELVAGSAEETA